MAVIGGLLEVIVYVEDMSRQVAFYRDVMGLAIKVPQGVEDYGPASWVELDTGQCSLCLHAGGQRRFGPDAPKFVFHVSDVAEIREVLVARGVPMGPVRAAAPGVQVCDGTDPEGNKFSIESHA